MSSKRMEHTSNYRYTHKYIDLVVNKDYFLRTTAKYEGRNLYSRVTFINYTHCPAVVIVLDENGRRFPCNRDDLVPKIPAVLQT